MTFAVFSIFKLSSIPIPYVVPILVTPFLFNLFSHFILPDLMFASAVAVFLFFLACESMVGVFIFLSVAALCRPMSALLLGITMCIVCAFRKKWGFLLIAAFGVLIPTVGLYLICESSANVHQAPVMAYLPLKIAFNFFRNYLGLRFNTNTLNECDDPMISLSIPDWAPLGSIETVEFCGLYIEYPLTTIYFLITVFGALPVVVFASIKRDGSQFWKKYPLWIETSILYGSTAFLLGPCLGSRIEGLISFGWPAFLLAGPFLMFFRYGIPNGPYLYFVAMHLVVTWLPALSGCVPFSIRAYSTIVIITAVICNATAFQVITKRKIS
jgi:hypothetical protein